MICPMIKKECIKKECEFWEIKKSEIIEGRSIDIDMSGCVIKKGRLSDEK